MSPFFANMASFPNTAQVLRRAPRVLHAATQALLDPTRGDMVARVGDLTSDTALERLRRRLQTSHAGRDLLQNPPSARFPAQGSATLAEYRDLRPGTLGRAYADFMDTRGFSPEGRSAVGADAVRDPELAFILQRYRDVHDIWHVLTACPTTVPGEVAQKWFEAVHTGLPVAWLSATVGPARMSAGERRLLLRRGIPWALRCAMDAVDLVALRYEDFVDEDLAQLRTRWGVTKAPDLSVKD